MKKLLILLVSLLPLIGFSQQIDKIYKENGVWKGDISGPLTTYPKQGVVIVDTTAIPDPVPIPPPAVLTSVDNMDKNIVYSPAWTHNGSTDATGFYNNTLAYDPNAGRTVTLTFIGTIIEVFCEVKPGHGSAKFQVDNLPDTTKNLGAMGGPVVKSVYNHTGLSAGQHTFKLTVVGSGNVVFDYVKIDGITVTPPVTPVPPDPIPPVTGAIFLTPGLSTKAAIESASSGTKFQLGNGTYPETITINVPIGVSILPPTTGTATYSYNGQKQAQGTASLFNLNSGSRTNGNQTISGFTILGKNLLNGGIYVANRDNVKIDKVKIQDTNFFAVWVRDATNPEVSNSEFLNASYASDGWCTGEILILNLTGMNIHHNIFSSNNPNEGYGISVYGNAPQTANPMNGRIHYNTVAMHPSSIWAGGKSPNIGIEFHDVRMAGVEIDHNTIRNVLSIDPNYPTYSGRTNVHDNEFIMGGASFAIELATSNISITNNNFSQTSIMTADFEATGKHTNIIIDGNTHVSNNANPSWGGVFLIGSDGVQMIYKNNKITKGNYPLFFYDDGSSPSKSQLTDGGGNIIK